MATCYNGGSKVLFKPIRLMKFLEMSPFKTCFHLCGHKTNLSENVTDHGREGRKQRLARFASVFWTHSISIISYSRKTTIADDTSNLVMFGNALA